VAVYADLSDPLEYLTSALSMSEEARQAGTAAVVAGGAFPGLSNVIAVELASRVPAPVKNLKFSYFTAGTR
jgi:saccharopine dehydrogenase-like NADP-dependent oxidoreductase